MAFQRFLNEVILPKAKMEFMLYCLGLNVRKLFRFFRGKAKRGQRKAPAGLTGETFKKPSVKKIENRMAKWDAKNKGVSEKAKREHKHARRKRAVTIPPNPLGDFVTAPVYLDATVCPTLDKWI